MATGGVLLLDCRQKSDVAGGELDRGLDCALLVADDDTTGLVQLQLVGCHDVELVWNQARQDLGVDHLVKSKLSVLLARRGGDFCW